MASYKSIPSQQYLCSIFDYGPSTGVLLWKRRSDSSVQWNGKFAGKEAGSIKRIGRNARRAICINNSLFLAHRLIWVMMTGRSPSHEIDHIDGDPLNNRWTNLREATHQQNGWNQKGNDRSLPKGVSTVKNSRLNPYRARITMGGIEKHLGCFKSAELSHAAYRKAAIEAWGEYARFE